MIFRILLTGLMGCLSWTASAATITEAQIIKYLKGITDNYVAAAAIVRVESKGDPMAVPLGVKNPAEISYGLMQIKYETARSLGYRGNRRGLFQWRTNLYWGAKYLDRQISDYHGDLRAALAAYNAGAAYKCKPHSKRYPGCRPGKYVNQSYVDDVMGQVAILGSFLLAEGS